MKSLLIVAHGSRKMASNDEVRQLTDRIKNKINSEFDFITPAFLELAEPSIPDGLRQCIDAGSSDITVLPYFLSAGRHVTEDIPSEVQSVSQAHPDIKIHITPHIGGIEQLADLMIEQVTIQ